jgi:hypothetical protein
MCGTDIDPRLARYLFVNWGWRGRSSFLPKDQADERLTLCGPHGDKMVAALERYALTQKKPGRGNLDRDIVPMTFDG